MTQVFMEAMSLEDALRGANLVVVVSVADPPSVEERLPMPRPAAGGGEAPPYVMYRRRLRVDEILHQRVPAGLPPVAVGELLEVRPGGWSTDRGCHEAYYCDDIGESPIVLCYQGSVADDAMAFIAFLVRERGDLRFSVDGAWEALEQRARVEAILSHRA